MFFILYFCTIYNGMKDKSNVSSFFYHYLTMQSLRHHWWLSDSSRNLSQFFATLREVPKVKPVNSWMFSSHLFLCLPIFLPFGAVPCRMVFTRLVDFVTQPLSPCFLIISWYFPINLNRTSQLNSRYKPDPGNQWRLKQKYDNFQYPENCYVNKEYLDN